jgi:hypothetical protein
VGDHQIGPKSTADLWMTFHRDDELTDEQRRALEDLGQYGRVVVRDRLRPVANLGLMKPAAAPAAIEAQIPFRFRASSEFPAAWKALDCRPSSGASHPERTKDQFCVYDEPHRDYLYTQAFVDKVVRETRSAARFTAFIRRKPAPKPT